MRKSRGRWPVWALISFLAVLGASLLTFDPVPEAGAAQGMAGDSAGAVDCSAPLPAPSDYLYAKSEYERILQRFLKAGCYLKLGWRHDKELRATGPTVAALAAGTGSSDPHIPSWVTTTLGTHNTVVIYYSPDVYRWMCERDAAHERRFVAECRATCPTCNLGERAPGAPHAPPAPIAPIGDGSMILKGMFGNTNAADLENPGLPQGEANMYALMVKDAKGSKDGWYWGSWDPQATEISQLDWPPPANLPYPWMGFGYYCVNCHASAKDEFTFSDLNNVLGDPDSFLQYYYQDQPPISGVPGAETPAAAADRPAIETLSSHERFEPIQDLLSKIDGSGPAWNEVPWPNPVVKRVSQPYPSYSTAFLRAFGSRRLTPPGPKEILDLYMPPEVYDHSFARPGGPPLFFTSDQCVGCHAAGSTGLHYDMTVQKGDQKAFTNLVNIAPYGEWRASPMGLGGRDPIFFSQLESEQALHPALAKLAPDLCLHCHGVMGQRQFCLDQFPGDPKKANEVCNNTDLLGLDPNSQPIVKRALFSREQVKAIPFGARTEEEKRNALYGGLARDGISCATCHHIEIDEKTPIGHTFTGDFRVGKPEEIHGPFEGPQQVPMDHSLGAKPIEYPLIRSSKVCGSCHSVVLPVFDGDKPWVRPGGKKPEIIIEQATYPEWVFSDFRDEGPTPRSCQNCHMATTFPGLQGDLNTKIASIQEARNMPQTENRLSRTDIDLKSRTPFARHTLVGLNVFFNLFAQQFPDILGIRIQDPMLGGKGIAPLQTAYDSMVQQAETGTATVAVTGVSAAGGRLVTGVKVENLAGHKLPSGVGFRRAFLAFEVLDAQGNPLWVSGRTDPTGVLVTPGGAPIEGELMWQGECRPKTIAQQKIQPHYETISRQDQVQIYQELVRDPRGRLTTSFLSLAHVVKDNRLLPRGWTPSVALAEKAGLGSPKLSAAKLTHHVLPDLPDGQGGEVRDPWYLPVAEGGKGGGGDELTYSIPLADIPGAPASVRVTLYYQAIPPFYLQDRFCTTPTKPDTGRLFFLAGHANLEGTRAEGWKLQLVSTGTVPVGGTAQAGGAARNAAVRSAVRK